MTKADLIRELAGWPDETEILVVFPRKEGGKVGLCHCVLKPYECSCGHHQAVYLRPARKGENPYLGTVH